MSTKTSIAPGEPGFLARPFRGLFRLIENSWQMYPIGLLFGLGLDTATEVGFLGISATEASEGPPDLAYYGLSRPVHRGNDDDRHDRQILMLGAYGWAFARPLRKLYYNITMTAVSVVVAVVIGGVQALNLISSHFGLADHGGFFSLIRAVDKDNWATWRLHRRLFRPVVGRFLWSLSSRRIRRDRDARRIGLSRDEASERQQLAGSTRERNSWKCAMGQTGMKSLSRVSDLSKAAGRMASILCFVGTALCAEGPPEPAAAHGDGSGSVAIEHARPHEGFVAAAFGPSLRAAPKTERPIVLAHAIVVRTSPPQGGVAAKDIGKVDVWYDAGIRNSLAALAVVSEGGERVDKRDAAIDSADPAHVSVSVNPLNPGKYTVRYRALSADGHLVSGAWDFEVQP